MNIIDFSSIPTIPNLVCAVPQAGMRCNPDAFEKVDSTQSGSTATGTLIKNIDWYDRKGFQTDYSVRDAAASLFKQEYGTFNIFDPQSISKHVKWIQDRYKAEGTLSVDPTERELDAYLNKLREGGLDGKMDWSSLSR